MRGKESEVPSKFFYNETKQAQLDIEQASRVFTDITRAVRQANPSAKTFKQLLRNIINKNFSGRVAIAHHKTPLIKANPNGGGESSHTGYCLTTIKKFGKEFRLWYTNPNNDGSFTLNFHQVIAG